MLRTKRFLLRAPLESDLDAMFRLYSDPKAMKFWSTAPHETIAVTKSRLDRHIADWEIAPVNFQIDFEDNYIGNAGNVRNNEIGFMLNPTYWRQGVLTEVMTTIIPYLFDKIGHKQLTAEADPLNVASVGLLRSLGFTETHREKDTLCINGYWSDSVFFEMRRPAN